MRNDGALQRGIEDVERLVEALPGLVIAHSDKRKLVRNAGSRADFEPAAAQLIEHADFFDEPKRMMQRQRVEMEQPVSRYLKLTRIPA